MDSLHILFAVGAISFVLYRSVIFPTFVSPLAKIPNAHFTASFSPLWILWIRYRCKEVRTIHAAHEKLGPVVRLGSNELSVNCIEGGLRTIYNGNFKKHDFYPNLFTANSGVAVLFSEVENKPHARRKRLISNIYSKSTLQSSPTMGGICHSIIRERLMPKLQAHVRADGEVEMFYLTVAITMDFITAYQFGLRNGTDFISNVDGAFWWIKHFDQTKEGSFWAQELPSVAKIVPNLGMQMIPESVATSANLLETWCLDMMEKADRSEEQFGDAVRPEDVPVHYRKLKKGFMLEDEWPDAKKAAGRTHERWRILACAELFDNIGGAQEGTATAIFYILRELARSPEVQSSLRIELRNLSHPSAYTSAGASLPHPKDIDGLCLLDAVIMETLRVFPPMAGPQPRVTPPNATIGPYSGLPAGVRVSSQPHSLHHNSTVFPAPQCWKPERWMDANVGQRAEMMNWFWGFGSGATMCLGSHFALLQMKLVTAAIVSNYCLCVVDDSDTDQMDAYSAQPTTKRLILKFTEGV